jgi:lipid A disaccharide synthetase
LLDIVITANSPGEVAAWVKPTVKELKRVYPESRISVFLPPCVFASGSEKGVLEGFPEIDTVFDQGDYLKYIILHIKPVNFQPGKEGIVIFLGGDLFHAVLLGKRLNYPVIAYTEGVYNWGSRIQRFMVPDERTRKKLLQKGASKEKVEIIGNLMLDAVEPEKALDEIRNHLNIKDNFILTLFPGSRPDEVEYMFPFFLDTIRGLAKGRKDLEYFLNQSPFVSDRQLEDIFNNYLFKNNLSGEIIKKGDHYLMKINNDLEIKNYINLQYSLMQVTDLAITVPGTNNLELAYFGIPMVVVLPLNKPEKIPLEGLLGLIGQVPLLGTFIMRSVIPGIAEKIQYVALCNTIAEKRIVPELKGVLTPVDLIIQIEELLRNRSVLKKMSQQLKEIAGTKGATGKLIKIVDQVLASSR